MWGPTDRVQRIHNRRTPPRATINQLCDGAPPVVFFLLSVQPVAIFRRTGGRAQSTMLVTGETLPTHLAPKHKVVSRKPDSPEHRADNDQDGCRTDEHGGNTGLPEQDGNYYTRKS